MSVSTQAATLEGLSFSGIDDRGQALTFASRLCVVPDVLSPSCAQEMLSWALSDLDGFQAATTIDGPPDARRSMVRYTTPPRPFEEALATLLPAVESVLGVTALERRVDCQVTIHQDGDYFRRHLDIGEGGAATRRISFIYYLHRAPRPFTGGQLRVYDTLATQERIFPAASFRDIEPVHNSIVFFPSASVFHEVLPVSCASHRPEDSRISLNGWVH
ncbi:2OG-Fe(II) oxygenase [Streptomyces sp. NPDC086549]|uniref:2OG-Fe(II) oxygenase n=1 Tax=Streptomyces sp. NPDC086549 TaxID=3365752 RepID=UPI00381B9BC1